MKPRSLPERLARVLGRLDARLEGQTLKPGADSPHCTAVVGAFHQAAGQLERRADAWPCPAVLHVVRERAAYYAAELRVLRRVVEAHRLMVALRGLYAKRAGL